MSGDRLTQAMLFDFYGELLTQKQREYIDLHYNEDLSLGEIAEQAGISRQGVWDMIRRGEEAMEAVEKKTGIIERFDEHRRIVCDIEALLETLKEDAGEKALSVIDEIGKKLQELKG